MIGRRAPPLRNHSQQKLNILRNYIAEYLKIRCQIPQQSRFRLAIIDGFAGGGKYEGGEHGSPLIFLELLIEKTKSINIDRAVKNMAQIQFECLLIFNDKSRDAIEELKRNTAEMIASSEVGRRNDLKIKPIYMSEEFEQVYPKIKKYLASERIHRNVFFNLDQCGTTGVLRETIKDILTSYQSAEVILNFSIESMLTYLSRNNLTYLIKALDRHGLSLKDVENVSTSANNKDWRAAIEKLVFDSYRDCGPYCSPFAINNPEGWMYWLLHFANRPKARQVYNDLLHEIPKVQAHFGRAGLNMLLYDPRNEGQDYLFSNDDRQRARDELYNDIPKVISEFGDAISVSEFIRSISNETPSHSMDILQVISDNPDLTVLTDNGRERRSPNGIRPTDTLILNPQQSLFLMPPFTPRK